MAMFANRGIHEHGLGMGLLDQVGFALVDKRFRERVLFLVFGEERWVCVSDAHQFDVLVLRQRGKKALHVAMREPHNGHAQRRRSLLGRSQAWHSKKDHQKKAGAKRDRFTEKTRHASSTPGLNSTSQSAVQK